jgi:hypothetical protein
MAIRRLVNFVRLFRLLLELYPEAENMVAEKINKFINDPNMRVKDHCSSLGDLLAMTTVS